MNKIWIKPNVFSRIWSEYLLMKVVKSDSRVLMFGNLPPLFSLGVKTTLFLQNALLLKFDLDRGYPLKAKLRHFYERCWLRFFIRNVDEVVVQNTGMKDLADNIFGGRIKVKVAPFSSASNFVESAASVGCSVDRSFVYVASGEKHKNHRRLVEAWIKLSEWGVMPNLTVTLDREDHADLVAWIDSVVKQFNLNILNVGRVPKAEVDGLYTQSDCLVYPSLTESFGLPLVEARARKLSILASELGFVRDLIDPEETFDPCSPLSIARAVCRYLGVTDVKVELLKPEEFVARILAANL